MRCDCGRNDGWHRPHCRALSAAVLRGKVDNTHWVYQDRKELVAPWPTYGACGVEGCLECLPLFDANNAEIPGTSEPGQKGAC